LNSIFFTPDWLQREHAVLKREEFAEALRRRNEEMWNRLLDKIVDCIAEYCVEYIKVYNEVSQKYGQGLYKVYMLSGDLWGMLKITAEALSNLGTFYVVNMKVLQKLRLESDVNV